MYKSYSPFSSLLSRYAIIVPSCFSPASHDAIAFAGTLDELVNVTVFTSLLVIGPLNAGESDEE